MRIVLTILIICLPHFSFCQLEYKTIRLQHYVSNPPKSDFFCDTIVCEGHCISHFSNGQKKLVGRFKKGQPIDSVFWYYRNGNLQKLFIPYDKDYEYTYLTYYENGQLKSIINTRKRFEREYYSSGQLKKNKNWNRNLKARIRTYYDNGILKEKESWKKLRRYNLKGILMDKIKRSEVNRLEKFFFGSKKVSDSYKYRWKTFDTNGVIKRRIDFTEYYGNNFENGNFPDSVTQIKDYLFDQIIFYKKGKQSAKITTRYVIENNDVIKKLTVYTRQKNRWIFIKEKSINEIYRTLKQLRQN